MAEGQEHRKRTRLTSSTGVAFRWFAAGFLFVAVVLATTATSSVLLSPQSDAGADGGSSCGPAGSVTISGTIDGTWISPVGSGPVGGIWDASWTQDDTGTITSGTLETSFGDTDSLAGATCQDLPTDFGIEGDTVSSVLAAQSFTVSPAGAVEDDGTWTADWYLSPTANGTASGTYTGSGTLVPDGSLTPTVSVTDNGPVTAGTSLVFTAAVSGDGPVPTGTVSWSISGPGSPTCSDSTLDGSGSATCTIPNAGAGQFTATASYSGDSNYSSGSGDDTATVNPSVGSVTQVTGTVSITHANGSVTTAVSGSPIALGDTIQTSANGGVTIGFVDQTTLAMGEDTRLLVDQYVYNPTTQQGSSLFSFLQGAFTYVSGLIGKNDPGQENVETPVGALGIRGTEFIAQVNPTQSTLQMDLIEGEVAITPTLSGVATTMDAPEAATSDSSSVSEPTPITESAFELLEAQLFPVVPPFEVSPASLSPATPGAKYGPVTLQAVNLGASTAPYTTTLKWKKISLPKGLKLSSAGVLSGTLNKNLAASQSSITIEVTETVTTLNGTKKVKTTTTNQATIPLTVN